MATHSSILAWRTPGTEEPDGLQSMGLQRVRHNWADKQTHWQISELVGRIWKKKYSGNRLYYHLLWIGKCFILPYFFQLIKLFLATPHSMQNFPDQGSNPCPLHWKHGVLTTGPPGSLKSVRRVLPCPPAFKHSLSCGCRTPASAFMWPSFFWAFMCQISLCISLVSTPITVFRACPSG